MDHDLIPPTAVAHESQITSYCSFHHPFFLGIQRENSER